VWWQRYPSTVTFKLYTTVTRVHAVMIKCFYDLWKYASLIGCQLLLCSSGATIWKFQYCSITNCKTLKLQYNTILLSLDNQPLNLYAWCISSLNTYISCYSLYHKYDSSLLVNSLPLFDVQLTWVIETPESAMLIGHKLQNYNLVPSWLTHLINLLYLYCWLLYTSAQTFDALHPYVFSNH